MAVGGCALLDGGRHNLPVAHRYVEPTGFVTKTARIDGHRRKYVLYIPANYDPRKKWPLIVFLHGASRRGSDGVEQTDQGMGPAIKAHPGRFPCLVLMPQCPRGKRWDTASEYIDIPLDRTLHEYPVDLNRVYLTGCSMGGFGTFYYGSERTNLYAAMMPISGGGRVDQGPELAHVPMWIFHNRGDRVVPVSRSRTMVKAIEHAHGDVRYTEFPVKGHDAWTRAYNDPHVIQWLLHQHKG